MCELDNIGTMKSIKGSVQKKTRKHKRPNTTVQLIALLKESRNIELQKDKLEIRASIVNNAIKDIYSNILLASIEEHLYGIMKRRIRI